MKRKTRRSETATSRSTKMTKEIREGLFKAYLNLPRKQRTFEKAWQAYRKENPDCNVSMKYTQKYAAEDQWKVRVEVIDIAQEHGFLMNSDAVNGKLLSEAELQEKDTRIKSLLRKVSEVTLSGILRRNATAVLAQTKRTLDDSKADYYDMKVAALAIEATRRIEGSTLGAEDDLLKVGESQSSENVKNYISEDFIRDVAKTAMLKIAPPRTNAKKHRIIEGELA